ncbi:MULTISPECIES: hypothetical protein [Cryobacterium]|uniref:hypothetical protein n=1 Tax=Cryobacterium TaxID=69578 RepID=UPI000CD3E6DD|nr:MULTISPECIES: hypothetical protein [Cryobacterium]POH67806.1 hypothetical protein C3B60_06230 [Cryobacterium zongtaii]TFC47808.1 hypothetical protein E3O57_02430 [Cryobacterium sp. TMN-39-2]
MIDADGNVYGQGRITFPPSPARLFRTPSFRTPEADLVQVTITSSRSLSFTSSRAIRDPVTGYLTTDITGPRIFIPQGLGSLLITALAQSYPANPITFALDAAGQLSTVSEANRVRQGLSDWRGSVTYAEGALTLHVSAALRSLPPIYSFDELEDPWPVDDTVPGRVDVEFEMDAITSVARFGGYWKALSQEREREPSSVVRTSVDAMRLESAPFGFHQRIYGLTKDDLYVGIYEVADLWNSLSLSAPSAEPRFASGLIVGYNHPFPRITFEGVNLDVVVGSMWATRNFGLTLTSGRIGYIEWSGGGSDGPGSTSKLLEASLNFELTMDGLVLSYSALPESSARGALIGEITIPWEVLTIRSPLFVRHREKLLAGKPQFGS